MRHSKDGNFRRRRAEWLANRGKTTSVTIEPEPELFEDLNETWQAWQTLNLCRPAGMSPSGIPWSELSRYGTDHGMEGDELLRFCRLVHAADIAWLAEQSKRMEESANTRTINRRDRGAARSE